MQQPPKSFVLWTSLRLLVWLTLSGCAGNTLNLQSAPVNAPSVTRAYEQANRTPEAIQFVWNAPITNTDGTPLTDLAGYKLHYGRASRTYTRTLDVGMRTTYTPRDWEPGQTYYVALSAYDTSGNESDFTPELRVTLPRAVVHVPALTMTPLIRGRETRFEVASAHAGDTVFFFFSLTGRGNGPCARELGGLCLDLHRPQTFGKVNADAAGTATLTLPIPRAAPAGQELFIQAVVRGGATGKDFVKTNVVARVVQ